MSVNCYEPHLIIVPEDDANRQLALGFQLEVSAFRSIQILRSTRGWGRKLDDRLSDLCTDLNRYPERRVVLLVDFDGNPDRRRERIRKQIPENLQHRIYIIGVSTEAEDLKRRCDNRHFESIGTELAGECTSRNQVLWKDELLSNNQGEIERFEKDIHPFLFP